MSKKSVLFLVPTPLDFGCDQESPLAHALPDETIRIAARMEFWICEKARSARAFLNRVDKVHALALPIQSLHISELSREIHKKGDHFGHTEVASLLRPALDGHDMGLLSEAGMPAIADPGSSVVRAAHDLGLRVVPLGGPVSIVLALAASGMNGQNFAFVGYLPQDGALRKLRLRELEAIAVTTGQAQIFIETPYRNAALASAMLEVLQPSTRMAISAALTLKHETTRSALVSEWRKSPTLGMPDNATPSVFMLGR